MHAGVRSFPSWTSFQGIAKIYLDGFFAFKLYDLRWSDGAQDEYVPLIKGKYYYSYQRVRTRK